MTFVWPLEVGFLTVWHFA